MVEMTSTLRPRNIKFNPEQSFGREWNGGDAFRTAFFNAMSILFPYGEKSFIDSVRHHQDCITDPRLKSDVQGFIAQEYVHRREHQRFNEQLCAARGYDLDLLEQILRDDMAEINKTDALVWLASTVAYEHFTATIAHNILSVPAWLSGADPEMARMWRWHAIEEIEHKSVAFDVYMAAGGTRSRLRYVMVLMTWEFLVRLMWRNLRIMFRTDRVSPRTMLAQALSFLLGRDGFFRASWGMYWKFFRHDFHPNDIDDAELLGASMQIHGLAHPV